MNTNTLAGKLRKWSSVPLAALLLTLPVMAQNPTDAQNSHRGRHWDPAKMVDRQVSHMKTALKLDANQEVQVRTILEDRNKKMAALRTQFPRPEKGQKPSAEAMAAFKQLRADTHDQLAKVLNADQLTQFDQMNKRHFRRHHAKPE